MRKYGTAPIDFDARHVIAIENHEFGSLLRNIGQFRPMGGRLEKMGDDEGGRTYPRRSPDGKAY